MTLIHKEIREILPTGLLAITSIIMINLMIRFVQLLGYLPRSFSSSLLYFSLAAIFALLGAHALLSEVERGSHMFLAALPQSASQTWLQKTLIALIVCFLCVLSAYLTLPFNPLSNGFWLLPSLLLAAFAFSNLAGHFFRKTVNAALVGFGLTLFFVPLLPLLYDTDLSTLEQWLGMQTRASLIFCLILVNSFVSVIALTALGVSWHYERAMCDVYRPKSGAILVDQKKTFPPKCAP
ncbi:hypothetical protein JXQ70_14715 [bacterium]|nr:hypothetical protein [bacterium]